MIDTWSENKQKALWRKCVLGLLLLLPSLCGCGNSGNDGGSDPSSGILEGRDHPTEKNLAVDGQAADIVGRDDAAHTGRGKISEHAHSIRMTQNIATIGQRSGDHERMIGEIQDVALLEDRVYLLDSKYKEIRGYKFSGGAEDKFGGAGRGPKQFQYPQAIGQLGKRGLFVVDRNRTLKVVEKTSNGFSFEESFKLDHMPLDACGVDGKIVTMGFHSMRKAVLHLYSSSGEHLRSFGHPYKANYQLARRSLSRGRVACEERSESIVMMFYNVPVLRAYSLDGKVRWKSKLKDFKPAKVTEIVEDGHPGLWHRTTPGWSDKVTTVTDGPGNTIFVQVQSLFRSDRKTESVRDTTFHTYLFSGKTGSGMYVGTGTAHVRAASNHMVVVGSNTPFPEIQILKMGNDSN